MNSTHTTSIEPFGVGAKDAAKIVGVSQRTWLRLCAMEKAPPGSKLGGRRLWRVEDLRRFVADGFRWEGGAS